MRVVAREARGEERSVTRGGLAVALILHLQVRAKSTVLKTSTSASYTIDTTGTPPTFATVALKKRKRVAVEKSSKNLRHV
jgi:hypothetical protein